MQGQNFDSFAKIDEVDHMNDLAHSMIEKLD